MARMFCTLKEAAAWLNTSESDLKTMLEKGVVPEFRNGENRLLRISDVRDMVRSQSQDHDRPSGGEPVLVDDDPSGPATQETLAPEIRLPRIGAAVLEPPVSDIDPSVEWDVIAPSLADELEWRFDESDPDSDRQRPAVQMTIPREPEGWRKFPTEPPRVGRGLWMGIIDDRPMAILGVSALIIAIASALASAVYVFFKFLQ